MTDADVAKAAEALIERRAGIASNVPSAAYVRRRSELRREDAKRARTELSALGLDLKRLDALAGESERAHQALAEEAHQTAVAGSEAAARRLRAFTPEPADPAGPQEVILDQVLFIRGFADAGTVSDSGTYPGDNWAQYRFRSGLSGRLSFFTLWQNTQNRTVFASAAARLIVNAHLHVYAGGTGIAVAVGFRVHTKATVRARTTLYPMWDPTTSVVGDETVLGKVEANGGFSSDSDNKSIQFNELLPAPAIAVPKKSYLLIEVELLTDRDGDDFDFDAESGAFRVDQPTINLTLTT